MPQPRTHSRALVLASIILCAVTDSAAGATEWSDGWLSRLEEAAGHPLVADVRLDAAAAALAADVIRERVLLVEEGRAFTAARRHLWEQGVMDPELVHAAVLLDGATADVDGVLSMLGTIDRHTHVGFGSAHGDTATCRIVLLTRRALEVVEPERWQPATEQTIRVRLDPAAGEPTAWVLAPDATAHTIFLRSQGDSWVGTLPASAAPGIHRLEISTGQGITLELCAIGVADGGAGTTPSPSAGAGQAAEEHLWAMLAMERARLGLPALRPHDELAEVARGHSERLRGGAEFGHGPPASPAERVAATGLPHSRALENVARAADLNLAHTLIMASPGHRANLLDPGVTHGGIGVAVSEPLAWYVTQELVWLLPPLDLERELERARTVLTEHRRTRGDPPLRTKRALDRVAQRWADDVGGRGATALDEAQIRELTAEAQFHLDDAERVVAELAWIEGAEQLADLPLFAAPGLDQYGLGLYQPSEGGMMAVVVVLVDRSISADGAP